jgi:hypothetical protein
LSTLSQILLWMLLENQVNKTAKDLAMVDLNFLAEERDKKNVKYSNKTS